MLFSNEYLTVNVMIDVYSSPHELGNAFLHMSRLIQSVKLEPSW